MNRYTMNRHLFDTGQRGARIRRPPAFDTASKPQITQFGLRSKNPDFINKRKSIYVKHNYVQSFDYQ